MGCKVLNYYGQARSNSPEMAGHIFITPWVGITHPARSKDSGAPRALNLTPICKDKPSAHVGCDAQPLQNRPGHARVGRAGVHQRVDRLPARAGGIADLDCAIVRGPRYRRCPPAVACWLRRRLGCSRLDVMMYARSIRSPKKLASKISTSPCSTLAAL